MSQEPVPPFLGVKPTNGLSREVVKRWETERVAGGGAGEQTPPHTRTHTLTHSHTHTLTHSHTHTLTHSHTHTLTHSHTHTLTHSHTHTLTHSHTHTLTHSHTHTHSHTLTLTHTHTHTHSHSHTLNVFETTPTSPQLFGSGWEHRLQPPRPPPKPRTDTMDSVRISLPRHSWLVPERRRACPGHMAGT